MSLAEKIDQAFIDFDIINQVVNGDKDTVVQTAGGPIPSLAKMEDNIVVRVAAALTAVSSSAVTLGAGLKSFDVGSDKAFAPGQWVSAACPEGILSGTVVSLAGSILTINIRHVVGGGDGTNWTVSIAGAPGAPGSPGTPGSPGAPGAPGQGSGTTETLVNQFPWET